MSLVEGEIWLADAVEIIASNRRPECWEASWLTPQQKADLSEYEKNVQLYQERERRNPLSLADIEYFATGAGANPEPPIRSPAIEKLEARRASWEDLLLQTWIEVVWPALINGSLSAWCIVELEGVVPVPPDTWRFSANNLIRRDGNGRFVARTHVVLGWGDSGKPRVGRPYMDEYEATMWPHILRLVPHGPMIQERFQNEAGEWYALDDEPEAKGSDSDAPAARFKSETKSYPKSETDAWLLEYTERCRADPSVDRRLHEGLWPAAKLRFPKISKKFVVEDLWPGFEFGTRRAPREKKAIRKKRPLV